MSTVRRGDIYFADLSPVVGSEQGGMRPVLIVQNDTGNRHYLADRESASADAHRASRRELRAYARQRHIA